MHKPVRLLHLDPDVHKFLCTLLQSIYPFKALTYIIKSLLAFFDLIYTFIASLWHTIGLDKHCELVSATYYSIFFDENLNNIK